MKKLKVIFGALLFTATVNAQNVGIGTTTPSAKLHVGGGTRYGVADIGSIFLQSGTGGSGAARDWKMYVPMTAGNLAFRDMGFDNLNNGMARDAMVLQFGTGNVGIGTSNPIAKLHIGAGTRYSVADIGSILLQSGTGGSGAAREWKMYVPMTAGNLSFRDMGFDNLNNGMAGDAMVIQNVTGNVGIGTESPGAKLEINGSLKMTDGNQGAGKVLTSDDNGLSSWVTPKAPAFIFSTDQSVGNYYFIGVGTNGATFLRNSVVVPFDCTIGSIIFSVRTAIANTGIIASLWKSSNGVISATPLSATIADGTTQTFAVANGLVPLLQGDLISVQLNWSTGGASSNGATVTLTYK